MFINYVGTMIRKGTAGDIGVTHTTNVLRDTQTAEKTNLRESRREHEQMKEGRRVVAASVTHRAYSRTRANQSLESCGTEAGFHNLLLSADRRARFECG